MNDGGAACTRALDQTNFALDCVRIKKVPKYESMFDRTPDFLAQIFTLFNLVQLVRVIMGHCILIEIWRWLAHLYLVAIFQFYSP